MRKPAAIADRSLVVAERPNLAARDCVYLDEHTEPRIGATMAARRDEEFREFVLASQWRLLHAADLLTGDRGRAADLVQHSLLKAYLAWGRVRAGDAEAYARGVLVNGYTGWRRHRIRPEPPDPDSGPATLNGAGAAHRSEVLRALSRLTRQERVVVVLRYYIELTDTEIADELGCPVAVVQTTADRAMDKLSTGPGPRTQVTL